MKKRYHGSRKMDRMREDSMRMMERDPERPMMKRGSMRDMERSMQSKRYYDNSDPVPTTVDGLSERRAYMGGKESRKMIARDGAMIREDMGAPALLPQRIIEQYWPRSTNYSMGYVDDLFYGVQKQMHEDYDDLAREIGPKKY